VGDRGLEQRGVDALALAGLELVGIGRSAAHGGEDAGGDVGHGRADLDRRPARASPVIDMSPDMPWAMRSKPPRSAHGPVRPKPEISQ
jgi:hypothetical protein